MHDAFHFGCYNPLPIISWNLMHLYRIEISNLSHPSSSIYRLLWLPQRPLSLVKFLVLDALFMLLLYFSHNSLWTQLFWIPAIPFMVFCEVLYTDLSTPLLHSHLTPSCFDCSYIIIILIIFVINNAYEKWEHIKW